MATLKTDYKDYVADGDKKYRVTANADGTSGIADATTYSQTGDTFGASDINATNTAVNEVKTDMANIKSGDVTLAYVDAYTLGGAVTFANPMPDTKYSVVLTSTDQYGGGGSPWTNFAVDSKTVNGFHASRGNSSGAVVNTDAQHYMWIAVPYNS